MFITEINGKKLKRPLEVTISKTYIAEIEDPEFYGDGCTEEEATKDLKETIIEIYEHVKKDPSRYTKFGKKWKDKVLDLFE
jgi:DNA phosphorothioation-dependent restriction protein DptG